MHEIRNLNWLSVSSAGISAVVIPSKRVRRPSISRSRRGLGEYEEQ